MAGGRLTYEDRRHIAAGLAKGLTYAEIARSLDRPTSTIGRESHAQRRIRRLPGRPGSPGNRGTRAPAATGTYGHDLEAVTHFEEWFGELLIQTGILWVPETRPLGLTWGSAFRLLAGMIAFHGAVVVLSDLRPARGLAGAPGSLVEVEGGGDPCPASSALGIASAGGRAAAVMG
ncbi:helix-turn-helix domain-containing protein [Nonomuraea sp. NPDC050536]|uniref:helix-turn-helix domain-containing protein n=1 Tax=Nonomuraea sp. NPDC050536 TaxID=3364366 RepID=UPI0037C782F7